MKFEHFCEFWNNKYLQDFNFFFYKMWMECNVGIKNFQEHNFSLEVDQIMSM